MTFASLRCGESFICVSICTAAFFGHKNIQHTVRYTELAPDRFKNFWR